MRSLVERWRRARTDEDFAWACLFTNLAGVPGLGTVMARRWEGVPQLALSVAGGVLTTWWLVGFALAVLRSGSFPPEEGLHLRLGLEGLGLFGVGWLWALGSSVAVLRAARRRPPPPASRRP